MGKPDFHIWSRLRGNGDHTPDPDLESFKTSLQDVLVQSLPVIACVLDPEGGGQVPRAPTGGEPPLRLHARTKRSELHTNCARLAHKTMRIAHKTARLGRTHERVDPRGDNSRERVAPGGRKSRGRLAPPLWASRPRRARLAPTTCARRRVRLAHAPLPRPAPLPPRSLPILYQGLTEIEIFDFGRLRASLFTAL